MNRILTLYVILCRDSNESYDRIITISNIVIISSPTITVDSNGFLLMIPPNALTSGLNNSMTSPTTKVITRLTSTLLISITPFYFYSFSKELKKSFFKKIYSLNKRGKFKVYSQKTVPLKPQTTQKGYSDVWKEGFKKYFPKCHNLIVLTPLKPSCSIKVSRGVIT